MSDRRVIPFLGLGGGGGGGSSISTPVSAANGGTGVANTGTITNTNDVTLTSALAGGSERSTVVLDLFDRADATLNGQTCPTGQVWLTSGPGQATVAIEDGILKSASNVYCQLDYGTNLTRIAGVFSFTSVSTNSRTVTVVALIADTASIGLADMLHMIVSPDGWTMQKRVASGAFVALGTGIHSLMPDTQYGIAYDIDIVAHTVTVRPPQGPPVTYTDADITAGTIAPRYAIWQIIPDANGYLGRWHGVSAGPMVADAIRGLAGGIPSADMLIPLGTKFTRRQRRTYRLDDGDGWYRIATQATLLTFMMEGYVEITAQDDAGVRANVWRVKVATLHNTPAPIIAQEFGHGLFSAVNSLRLSVETGVGVALDINRNATNNVTLTVDFVGYFTVVDPPADLGLTVGATALATASTTLAFSDVGVASAAQAAVGTTAATQTTPWGFATQAQADALVTLVNELRRVAILRGDIKGGA